VANVFDGYIDTADILSMAFTDREYAEYRLQTGDILLNEGQSIELVGRAAMYRGEPVDCCFQNTLVRFRARSVSAEFAHALIRSLFWEGRLSAIATQTTSVAHLGVSRFASLPVALPPQSDQDKIAEAFTSLDATLSALRAASERLKRVRRTLMSDLLSGRKRVPNPVQLETTKVVQPAFKRAVFAAEVVHQLHGDARFGSVKHEKIVHTCELHLDLHRELDRHAYKKAAGPYDPKARRSVERIFSQQKWFNAAKKGGRVVYEPLEASGGHTRYFNRYFGERRTEIQAVIDLFRPMNTQQCEIVATLYAVWNDFLIDGRQPTNDEIVRGVLDNWTENKRNIAETRWRSALDWMRDKGLVPSGRGEKTRVAPA
jgi:hypothetical protein